MEENNTEMRLEKLEGEIHGTTLILAAIVKEMGSESQVERVYHMVDYFRSNILETIVDESIKKGKKNIDTSTIDFLEEFLKNLRPTV